ncbi:MAG: ABC transporter permease [Muribaculaceae bacterium]|nr:ABC transporter permease [Muribaculaceae bacterium]
MNRLSLIIRREYMSLVARKSFIVTTLLMPVLMIACVLIPIGISMANEKTTERTTIAVIDETQQLAGVIKSSPQYSIMPLQGKPGTTRPKEFLAQAPESVEALVVIPPDVLTRHQVNLYSKKAVSGGLVQYVTQCLNDTLTAVKLQQQGIPNLDKIVAQSQVDVGVNSIRLAADGSQSSSSTDVAMIIGVVLAFVTYMFVIMYGATIMNSVVEEKTNRIVEVVVSSCKPFELMMGKIIGVGLVGLTQFALWVAILAGVAGIAMSVLNIPSTAVVAAVDPSGAPTLALVFATIKSINIGLILVSFVVYFIGGYLLYASLFAAFGSAVDQASDASQFSAPIIMIMVIALYASIGCMENHNGSLAMWCSLIPFTSPVVMMVRLPFDVPVWQVALSIVLLFGTAVAMVWLSARIYRTGILLYGKKHSLKEIVRWVR